MNDDMIYIVAGNVQQAKQYAKAHGIYPPKWSFVSSPDVLIGASGSVLFVGTFYERKDKFDVAAAVEVAVEEGRLARIEDE